MQSLSLLLILLVNAVCVFTGAVYKVTNVKDHVNIRSGPGKNYKKVGELKENDFIFVNSTTKGWANFYMGYVSTNYLTKGTKCDRSQYETTIDLNFRYGPSMDYDILKTLDKGTKVYSYGKDPFNKYWVVTGKGYTKTKRLSLPIPRGPDEKHLTQRLGVFTYCKIQKETYYNLDMTGVIKIMRDKGFSKKDGWVYSERKDGCKMFGDYIMVAANLNVHPRGSFVETSLGTAIVCDTGEFAKTNPNQIDIAVNW